MSEFNNWKQEDNKQNQSEVERFGDDPSTAQRDHKKRTEISEGNGYVRIGDEYFTSESLAKSASALEDNLSKLRNWVQETPEQIRKAKAFQAEQDYCIEQINKIQKMKAAK